MTEKVDLVVTGMTCASCAQRIERKLNKLDGVEASVNYATGLARVAYVPSVTVDSLISTVEAAGYHALAPNPLLDQQVAELEHAHEQDLKRRWIIGLLLAIPVGVISMVTTFHFAQWQLLVLGLALPVVTWVAWPLHRTSFRNARYHTTTMDTLVSIGVMAAYLGSLYQYWSAAGHHEPHLYVEVAGVVPVFVLFGRWLESRNKRLAGSSLRALLDATPKSALVERDGELQQLPIDHIAIGDIVVVRPETTVPVDCEIVTGSSSVTTALLTGEAQPFSVNAGNQLPAGALNYDGELRVRVTAIGQGTHIARIAALVAAAQSGKADIARLADRISAIFVPVVLVLTAVTGLAWYFYSPGQTIEVMIAVLVIACPCALGLATPTALVVGSGRAATLGILVSGPEVFEKSPLLDTVIFDKTGTLTRGEISIQEFHIEDRLLPILKALVTQSAHPLSQAVTHHLSHIDAADLKNTFVVPGLGIKATMDSKTYEFGSKNFHPELGLTSSTTTSFFFEDGDVVGHITFGDIIDDAAQSTIDALRKSGLEIVVASGDTQNSVDALASTIRVVKSYGELKPADKISLLTKLQSEGHRVVMVGDGTNDAPALAAADLGIAMGRGTEVARATADITLLRADLELIPTAISLSRKTLRVIKQNLWWAFGYNVAAIPLAMTGHLNPMIAGIAMSASSVLVVTNSLRLRTMTL
jgi:Cu+-exporting ATPase